MDNTLKFPTTIAVTLFGLLIVSHVYAAASCCDVHSKLPAYMSTHSDPSKLLFEDTMTGNWQDNWFLDGKEAYVASSEKGLYFAAGNFMYPDNDNRTQEQREIMSANHAVLWTKQEFEGDIIVSFECTRMDMSAYGVNILYIQAQGIGTEEFPTDIYEWREFREVPAMGKYYTYMNALHISYNVGDYESTSYIRARRYPKNDPIGLRWGMTQLDPDYDDEGAKMMPGRTYIIEVEKTNNTMIFRTFDKETNALLKEAVWDISSDNLHELMEPKVIEKGRIGLRQMSTKKNIYSNFKVIRR